MKTEEEYNPILENHDMLIAYLKAGVGQLVYEEKAPLSLFEAVEKLYYLHLEGKLFNEDTKISNH